MKWYQDRIAEKYGSKNWSGSRYKELMSKIIENNASNVARFTWKLTSDKFKKLQKRPDFRALSLPDLSEVIPKRGLYMRKAAHKGELMTDNLRDKLTKNLRDVLLEPGYIRKRGKLTGTLRQEAIKQFEDKIKDTFTSYTKRDKTFGGVPANVHVIAVTEIRSAVDMSKHEYMQRLQKKNEDRQIVKRWKHNTRLVIKPRSHHLRLNGHTVGMDEDFVLHNKDTNKLSYGRYPHDENLPPEEVIGCSCEVIYEVM